MNESDLLSARLTAHSFMRLLASEMYDAPASLWEVVRNGLCACMPHSKWVPGAGSVEIFLEKSHPLATGYVSLVVLDHGRGFTPADLGRFCTIGVSLETLKEMPEGRHSGASQKGIGRLAGFALNKKIIDENDPTAGYYIITRTADRGDVRLLTLIPANMERDQKMADQRRVGADAPELGFLKGITGSFTAIVIPHSVFSSYEEIRRALEWRMPRKRDLTFKLKVGGTKIFPPPLASRVTFTSPDGAIEAHIDACGESELSTGLWFTDAATGLRVARVDPSIVPFPYSLPQFFGDIFVPNLLANQGTSRSGLSPRYLKSQAWTKVLRYLGTQSEKLRALLGEEERPGDSPVRESLQGFVALCHKVYGVPEVKGEAWRPRAPRKAGGDRGGLGSCKGSGGIAKSALGGSRKEEGPRHERSGNVIRIGERTYFLWPHNLDALTFAEVPEKEGGMLHINERGYQLMPSRKEARNEHVMNAILFAIASAQFPDSPRGARIRAAEWRLELLGKK